jgi:excisionase family DNA binding protein
MGRLLTARELADYLGVSPETVLRWTRRGELPAIRLPGGMIRYREDALDGWLNRRVTTSCHDASHPGRRPCGKLPNVTDPNREEE